MLLSRAANVKMYVGLNRGCRVFSGLFTPQTEGMIIYMGKIIAVASWKCGAGKTATVAAVSCCLAEMGCKTLCVDYGSELNNLDLALGMADSVFKDSMDPHDAQPGLAREYLNHPSISNLFFLPASSILDFKNRDIEDAKPLFDELRSEFDYCLIDAPSVDESGFRMVHMNADMSIIVAKGETADVRDALKAASAALDSGANELALLVNRIIAKNIALLQPDIDEVIETSGARLIGLIPEDIFVLKAIHESVPLVLFEKPLAAYHFLDVARRIAGETLPWRKLVSRIAVSNRNQTRDPEHKDELTDEMKEFYGEPETWAKSTLLEGDLKDLTKVHVVKPGPYVSAESLRQRIWLHDILDDKGILYRIEFIGYWASRNKFIEAQNIYVEKEYEQRVRFLIKNYWNTRNVIQDDLEERNKISGFDDGIPQKTCASCGEEMDFDYHTCPYCKTPFPQ